MPKAKPKSSWLQNASSKCQNFISEITLPRIRITREDVKQFLSRGVYFIFVGFGIIYLFVIQFGIVDAVFDFWGFVFWHWIVGGIGGFVFSYGIVLLMEWIELVQSDSK